jgi:hypothetical protein
LWTAWAIHLASFALTMSVLLVLVSWADAPLPSVSGGVAITLVDNIRDLVEFALMRPVVAFLTALSILLVVESAYLILAVVMMAWGACPEPIGASFRASLQRVWLHSAMAAPVFVICGSIITWEMRVTQLWWQVTPVKPTLTPWIIEYQATITLGAFWAGSLWALWSLCRFVGAPRPASMAAADPMCEWCGYNLTHVPSDGRCSECGRPVEDSLGADVRAGPAWPRRHNLGHLAAWWACASEVAWDPGRFGRRLQSGPAGLDHRVFVAWHVPAWLALGFASSFIFFRWVEAEDFILLNPDVFIAVGLLAGSLTVTACMTLITLASSVVGIAFHYIDRRNLMTVSAQIASYLSTYLFAWAAVAHSIVVVLAANEDTIWEIADLLDVNSGALATLLWLSPNVVLLVIYFALVARGTAAARYANR